PCVRPEPRHPPPASGAAAASEHALEEVAKSTRSAISAEDITKAAAEINSTVPSARRRRKICSRFPVGPQLVIPLALFGVGQNLVSFIYFLESLFRGLVAGIYVRVML